MGVLQAARAALGAQEVSAAGLPVQLQCLRALRAAHHCSSALCLVLAPWRQPPLLPLGPLLPPSTVS